LITSTRKPVNPIQLQLRVFALRGLLCLVLCPAVLASAQVGTASIAGIVEDTTMARIPNAGLKLINVMTGTENDSASSNNGVFLLPGVIPGNYTLQIEREGFATAQVTGIALNVGDTKGLLIRMTVGPVTDTVHIDASGITIDTVDAAASTVVDRNFVTNIPLNGRSFQDLISMTPGVLTENPQSADGRASAHGRTIRFWWMVSLETLDLPRSLAHARLRVLEISWGLRHSIRRTVLLRWMRWKNFAFLEQRVQLSMVALQVDNSLY